MTKPKRRKYPTDFATISSYRRYAKRNGIKPIA